MQWNPEEDGLSHIRIDGKTEAGAALADWQDQPFKDPTSKLTFHSLKGYKLWLRITLQPKYQSEERESDLSALQEASGDEVIKLVDEIERSLPDGFENGFDKANYELDLQHAMMAQFSRHDILLDSLTKSYLPFAYYRYNAQTQESQDREPSYVKVLEALRGLASYEQAKVVIYRLTKDGKPYADFMDDSVQPSYHISGFQAWLDQLYAWDQTEAYYLKAFKAIGIESKYEPVEALVKRCFFDQKHKNPKVDISFSCCQQNGYTLHGNEEI